MNWIDIAWPMMAAATLTLGLAHLVVWSKQRKQAEHFMLGMICLSMAVITFVELSLMRAQTLEQYASLLRWGHVPVAVVFAGMVCFLRVHFRAGNFWLGTVVVALRWALLLPDFLSGVNLNFREITSLQHIAVWHGNGTTVTVPVGIPNPWMILGQLSVLLMIVFLLDAFRSVGQRGNADSTRRAAFVCGSMAGFMLLAGAWPLAIVFGGIQGPFVIAPAFMGVVLVMSYELGDDLMHAAQLARSLQRSDSNLKEAEQHMEQAVRAAGIGLWHRDMHGLTWLSETSLRMLGFAPGEDFDRERFYERMHPADRENTQLAIAEAARTGGELKNEYRIVHPDGNMRWIAVRGQIEFGPDHAPARLRGVLLDISERKRAERDATVQREELTHLSRVALLSELSASLAHELNQPLTAILSNAQAAIRYLAHTPPNLDEVREILTNIVENDKRAGEVIRRLRAMLRNDPADYRRLDINEVVQDVLRIIRNDLLNRNVEVALQLAADLPAVNGDRVQLQQVLLNLIVNASDAMTELTSGRQLVVQTRMASVKEVEVMVSDIGRGIAAEDIERIFSPFVTTKADGMGLGLAVCTTIINAHRGKLWATNNSTRGATVHFCVPVFSDSAPA